MSLTSPPYRPSQQIDGPWLTDKRWGGGRITDGSKGSVIFLWVFAIFWSAVSSPAVIFGIDQVRRDKPETFLLFIFPLVGLGLLAGATYSTIRYLKFGRSFLELETLPGCLGGWLAGTVRTTAPLDNVDYVRLTLRCIHRVTTGHGKNRRTREDTKWESEQVLGGRIARERDGGHVIPVAFRIPPDARETFDSLGDDIVWRLRLNAPLPGADYSANFVVPVFAAAAQPTGFIPRAEHDAAKIRAPREAVALLDDSKIDISTNVAGRKRFVFPANRNRKTASVLVAFAFFFAGIAMALVHFDGPGVLAVIFGLVAALLTYVAAVYAFRHIELDADRGGIERRWRALVFSGQRYVKAADILELRKDVTSAVNDTSYYTIYAMLDRGVKVNLISGLGTNDADRVREELLNALGQHVNHAERADDQADHAVDREESQADLR